LLILVFKKIGYALLTLFGVVTVIFFMFSVLPGDPAQMMLGQNQSQEQLDKVKQKYGFDQPISVQYIYYLNDLSPLSFHKKDKDHYTSLNSEKYSAIQLFKISSYDVVLKRPYLRESFQQNGRSVSSIIAETLPNTAVLAISAISIALLIGILLGVFSAIFQDTVLDKSIQILSTLGMSLPSFFSAILFAWFFAYVLKDLTGLNMTGNLYELDDFGEQRHLILKNLILPAVVLGIRPLAVVSQLMRNALLEQLQEDYIRTARAKGLSEFKIIYKHALKNALNPVITAISGWFASMLAGAVFVEYIFGWNGLGKEIVNALETLDLPIIMGAVLIIALMFIIINIFVDIIYAWLDPRIRFST
jgi:peptide/nickel transport system permease protein